MAENVTPVILEIKDFAPREVMMIDYKFDRLQTEKARSLVSPVAADCRFA